jgi:hypothetical protein
MASAVVPSVKGSVFVTTIEDVGKLISSGELSRAEAERWLAPEDLRLLDEQIFLSHWYDVRSYVRLNELLRDVIGNGSNEFLRERGRETARRLLEAGLYAQLQYLNRAGVAQQTDAVARFEAFGRDLRLLSTLSGSIFNFTRWTPGPDPEHAGRYRIEVSEARDFPDVICWRTDGFVNEMASRHGEADLWTWDRPTPDRVVFRMRRAI